MIEIKDLGNIEKEQIYIDDFINIPLVKGEKGDKGDIGETGRGIINMTLNDDYSVTITYTDGTAEIFSSIRGEKGEKGDKGDVPIKGIDYDTEEEKEEFIKQVLDKVNQFSVIVVNTLPTENIDGHTIYFLPREVQEVNDIYDEYIYINNAWEHIGTTAVDLSDYYTKEEINTKNTNTINSIKQDIQNADALYINGKKMIWYEEDA